MQYGMLLQAMDVLEGMQIFNIIHKCFLFIFGVVCTVFRWPDTYVECL